MNKLLYVLGCATVLSFSVLPFTSCGGVIYVPGSGSGDDPTGDSDPTIVSGTDGGAVIGGDSEPGDVSDGDADTDAPDTDGTIPEDADGDGCTDDAVAVCHVPNGNPDAAHVICVSQTAVDALLEHGDTLGACPDVGPDPGEEPGEDPEPEPWEDPSTENPGNGSISCGSGKVEICHTPNGDASKTRTLCVGEPATGAHLDHDDTLGACPE